MMHNVVGGGYRPLGPRPRDERELIAGFQASFAKHTEIPAGAAVVDGLRGEGLDSPPACELPAGLPRLRYLKEQIAEGPGVADAHFAFGEALDAQVLAEGAGSEIGETKLALPDLVVIH